MNDLISLIQENASWVLIAFAGEEFIALNTHMIQKANTTIQSQQKEIDDLKKQVQDLQELVLSA